MPVLRPGHPADCGGHHGRAPLEWLARLPGLGKLWAAIMGVRYETRAERRRRIGYWIATAVMLAVFAGGMVLAFWGLSIPDPSMVRP